MKTMLTGTNGAFRVEREQRKALGGGECDMRRMYASRYSRRCGRPSTLRLLPPALPSPRLRLSPSPHLPDLLPSSQAHIVLHTIAISSLPPHYTRPDAHAYAGQFSESRGEIRFPEISTAVLEKVLQYMYYKVRYTNSKTPIPEFRIEPEVALELLMAANYLDC